MDECMLRHGLDPVLFFLFNFVKGLKMTPMKKGVIVLEEPSSCPYILLKSVSPSGVCLWHLYVFVNHSCSKTLQIKFIK